MTITDTPTIKLSKNTQKAIDALGFKEYTPIQALTIPYLMAGKDIVGQASTGTGKTAAFALPIIERLNVEMKNVQALILCPTRELAIQVHTVFEQLLKFHQGCSAVAIYGGQPVETQIKKLRKNPQIVIGTPGRTMDMVRRGVLKLYHLNTVVLDEADEMLNMGFKPDIEWILSKTPDERQLVFFSATMPKAILKLTEQFQNNPEVLKVASQEQDVNSIDQTYYELKPHEKTSVLDQLFKQHHFDLSIVFCNTKVQVDHLVKDMRRTGYSAEGLHSGKTQSQRDRVMKNFRKGETRVLIATDVAARGLDVKNVEAVINYDLPMDSEFYIHRIGRTGRAGKTGTAISFICRKEKNLLKNFEKTLNIKLTRKTLLA
jgi:ATP-dependent RNA helicase DeaD